MITLTKIFRFETAHAIYGYSGACANIHGHSYELHVTVAGIRQNENFIAGTGIIMDFKELKKLVRELVIRKFDHQLVLSKNYLNANKGIPSDALLIFPCEPTAENMLIFIREELIKSLPGDIKLISLKLYESRDSYAEWISALSF